jgi:sarcosine oxidase gamma subunit
VPELIAKTALSGQTVTHAGTTLTEVALGQITSVACYPGQLAAVTAALGAFPAPNSHDGGLCWTGPEQAFVMDRAVPDLTGLAATTDQSGGWTALRLSGPLAVDALMRLVPLDLRAMTAGQAARAPLGHMQMILLREAEGYLVLVFRSMARTAWHEIDTALKMCAARGAL